MITEPNKKEWLWTIAKIVYLYKFFDMINQVTVFCASSTQAADVYKQEARQLGTILAEHAVKCYYGGGRVGLMGELAKSMLEHNGHIVGIIPQFMVDEGWDNDKVEEIVVPDMQIRKQKLMQLADAIVALPGGCGTLEELMEAITARQLGLIKVPIVLVNVCGFFDPLIAMLERAVKEKFMRNEHLSLWSVVTDASQVLSAIENAPSIENARGIAAM